MTAPDPYLTRLAALDDALAYQAQICMDERNPAKVAACDNARLGLAIARDAYLLHHPALSSGSHPSATMPALTTQEAGTAP